jgi:hypothetical protein
LRQGFQPLVIVVAAHDVHVRTVGADERVRAVTTPSEQFCTDTVALLVHLPTPVERRRVMRNSQRYRLKAAECLAAAKLCQGDYRGLLVSIAVFWQWLARQDEAREKPLVSWEVGEPDRQTGQVLVFRPISPAGGSIRRGDTIRASRNRRDQIDAQLVVLGEHRAGHNGRP